LFVSNDVRCVLSPAVVVFRFGFGAWGAHRGMLLAISRSISRRHVRVV